jgi:hypothetical protein
MPSGILGKKQPWILRHEYFHKIKVGLVSPGSIVHGISSYVIPDGDRDLGLLNKEAKYIGRATSTNNVDEAFAVEIAALERFPFMEELLKECEIVFACSRCHLESVTSNMLLRHFQKGIGIRSKVIKVKALSQKYRREAIFGLPSR